MKLWRFQCCLFQQRPITSLSCQDKLLFEALVTEQWSLHPIAVKTELAIVVLLPGGEEELQCHQSPPLYTVIVIYGFGWNSIRFHHHRRWEKIQKWLIEVVKQQSVEKRSTLGPPSGQPRSCPATKRVPPDSPQYLQQTQAEIWRRKSHQPLENGPKVAHRSCAESASRLLFGLH